MRGFLIFLGDLISRIGVEIEIFEKGQNIKIKFFQKLANIFFKSNNKSHLSWNRVRRYVLQNQKLNSNFDRIENFANCKKVQIFRGNLFSRMGPFQISNGTYFRGWHPNPRNPRKLIPAKIYPIKVVYMLGSQFIVIVSIIILCCCYYFVWRAFKQSGERLAERGNNVSTQMEERKRHEQEQKLVNKVLTLIAFYFAAYVPVFLFTVILLISWSKPDVVSAGCLEVHQFIRYIC